MAETHRRVEPRGVVGTGMLNDPDRLRDIEQKAERFKRDRMLPKRKFGEVIASGPTTGETIELVDEEPQPDRRRQNAQAPGEPAADAPKAATFERRPPRGVGVIRPSAAPPRSAPARPAPSSPDLKAEGNKAPSKPAAATPDPKPAVPKGSPADVKDDKKDPVRPMATGSRTPEQAKQTGGHTQVTFKI